MLLLRACLYWTSLSVAAAACMTNAGASNACVNVMMVHADSFALLALVCDVSVLVPAYNTWRGGQSVGAMEKETGREPHQPALRAKRRRRRCSVATLAARPRNQGRHVLCKEYTSKYRKMATETLRRKRTTNNMSNETKRETNYSNEQQVKQQHAQHANHLSMNAERALLYTCSSCLTPHWLKI